MKAVYAGSFDPVTNGHLDIMNRAVKIFGSLTVLVMENGHKTPLLSVQERVELLKQVTAKIPGICVETAQGLLADYAKKNGVQVLVRGLRGGEDIEPEFCAAYFNKKFCPSAETVFLPTQVAWKYVSSSAVKEALRAGADIAGFVPPEAVTALKAKIK